MAVNWIKMRTNLLTHPKVVSMASALGADKKTIVGGLYAVWCLFDQHSEDGNLSGYTAATLNDEIRMSGFAEALAAVQWLEIREDGIAVPRFEDHNGQSAKRRAQETDRKREARNMSASDADKAPTKSGPEKKRKEKRTPNGVQESFGASEGFPNPPPAPPVPPAPPPPPPPPPPAKPAGYSEDFEAAWAAYPDRPGKSKADAWKAWSARLNAGVAPEALLQGVQRYAAYCVAEAKEPGYIKQPATFFGPGEHYLADWTPSLRRAPPQSPHEMRREQRKAWMAGVSSAPNPQPPTGEHDAGHRQGVIDAPSRFVD